MKLKSIVTWVVGLSAILAVANSAFAGIEPVPWHTIISNRTNQLDPASPFYNRNLSGMVLIVTIPSDVIGAGGTRDVVIPILNDTGGDLTLAPGQTVAVAMSPALSGQILSWSLKASLPPDPWHTEPVEVFAFETRMSIPPDPWQPPSLTASYLTAEMPILGFASPGTVVGTVQMVTDEMFYGSCPSIPTAFTWKNHGQYVRCIALRAEELVSNAQLTQEQADAAVSAAAQSETGRK